MHIVTLIAIGLVLLLCFVAMGRVCYSEGGVGKGAWYFFQVWLVIAVVNAGYGIVSAKLPILNEVAAFMPIFGVPGGIAYLLSRRFSVPAVGQGRRSQ
jgi:hypothetical protein